MRELYDRLDCFQRRHAMLALWSGKGVFLAAPNALNHVSNVPYERRPDFLRQRLRALASIALLSWIEVTVEGERPPAARQ